MAKFVRGKNEVKPSALATDDPKDAGPRTLFPPIEKLLFVAAKLIELVFKTARAANVSAAASDIRNSPTSLLLETSEKTPETLPMSFRKPASFSELNVMDVPTSLPGVALVV